MNWGLEMVLCIFLSLVLSFMMSILSLLLVNKTPDKEKVSIYECGFNPFNTPGEPYSISFFLMAILFLMFDLEIVLLVPWSMSSNYMNYSSQIIVNLFIFMLIMGLMYEWYWGGLEWE